MPHYQYPDMFVRFFGCFTDLDRDTIHNAMEVRQYAYLGKYIAEYKETVKSKTNNSCIREGLKSLARAGDLPQ